MTSSISIRALALAISVVAGMACAGSATDAGALPNTGSGGAGGCLTSACLPGLPTPVTTWAIEIDPPSSSAAALTELLDVPIGADALILTAVSQGPVTATFSAGSSGAVPSSANVVLTLPPQIGGRPDLTFEASATVGSPSTVATAALTVPQDALDRMATATLQLIPLSPADQSTPPTAFAVTVANSLSETLPDGYLSLRGTLLTVLDVPLPSTSIFVARAFQSGTQVSNAPVTGADGTFQLLLAPIAAGSSVIVELTPQMQGSADPWYTSSAIDPTMTPNLDPILLPAYRTPNVFTLTVEGADDPTATVGGALVRAQAILGSSAAGKTDFLRTGTTSAKTASAPGGTVNLSLLPGTATAALDYDLTVIPPASSPYATQCISPVGVTVGGTATAPSTLLSVPLPRRSVLTGLVTSNSGAPVASVAITATAGTGPTDSCTNTPAVSSSAITGLDGTFTLPLDPGSYRLDYDPPAGSPVPRLTDAVTVPAGGGQLTHDVRLAAGAVVQGTVYGPDGSALPSATVRIFAVLCSGQDDCFGPTRTAPGLVAQTVSDASGSFRAVVPALGAAN